jgi:sialidase-1
LGQARADLGASLMTLTTLLGVYAGLFGVAGKLRDVRIMVQAPPKRIVTDAGAGGYQAFPDVCRLKNGDLLCVFYAGYGHVSQPNAKQPAGGRVCAVRSTDEGETWSPPWTVVDTPADDRDPSVACLPNGTLLCTFFTYGKNTECDTSVTRSTDGGKTWSEPEVIVPSYATSTQIRRLRSGRLVLPVYMVDGNGKRAFAAVSLSDDNGKTWGSPRPIGQNAGKVLDETDVYERKDGTILAVMRQVMCGAESRDGGKTWGEVFELGFPGHCPCLLMTKAGVLLMAHRVPQTSLHYSLDEGRTWQGQVMIDNVIGAYPSLINLKDGRVLCVYYEEGANSAIRAVKLRITVQPK